MAPEPDSSRPGGLVGDQSVYSCLDDYARFAPIARSRDCEVCEGRAQPFQLGSIDAVYCISLVETPHRVAALTKLLHAYGLCQSAEFMVTPRQKNTSRAVWAAHRAVARRARARGHARVLILEDDAWFVQPRARVEQRLADAMQRLPADWRGLYLGHWPLQAYFAGRGLMRARSGCTHAYVVNTTFLSWLADTEPMDPRVPIWRLVGTCIDAAIAASAGFYAIFPMLMVQRDMGDRRIDPGYREDGMRRSPFDPARFRDAIIFHGMRPAEIIAVALSPLHWLTLERSCARSGRARSADAELIVASGLFDPEYYLERYQDVAAAEAIPLWHFLHLWGKDRNCPHPLFDTAYYLERYPKVSASKLNPLVHYLRYGARELLSPHPLFDAAWYVGRHPNSVAAGLTPLKHYLDHALERGVEPNPTFSTEDYVRKHPHVAAGRQNPLIHFTRQSAGPES